MVAAKKSNQWHKADPNSAFWLAVQAGIASETEGPPGVAKSSSVLQMCKSMGRDMMLLIGSTHAPEDVAGIPFVSSCKAFFDMVPPRWAERLSRPGALLFIDELTTVPPAMRAALLSMLTERRLGSLIIHPDTLMAAACNPAHMAPNASPLEKSMANRFFHCEWRHDFDSWQEGMESENDAWGSPWFPVVESNWRRHAVKWGHMITGYLRKNSNERILIPNNDDEKAFPTPRTWHYLRNCLAAAESVEAPSHIQSQLAAGCVGKTVGANFFRYVSELDLVDPEAVLAGTATFVFDRKRVDLASALLTSLVSCIRREYSQDRLDTAVEVFTNNVGKNARDLVLSQLRHLVQARPDGTALSAKTIKNITEFGKDIPDAVRRRRA